MVQLLYVDVLKALWSTETINLICKPLSRKPGPAKECRIEERGVGDNVTDTLAVPQLCKVNCACLQFDIQLEGRCAWLTWLYLIGGLFSGSAAVD
ncbi:hypothetical protein AOLI_G00085900 [Acnodon oligacanthus]